VRKTTKSSNDVKDAVDAIVRALGELDTAITPRGRGDTIISGGHDASGGFVTSLTEAVMGVTAGLCRIADAIENHTAAMAEKDDV
jgi:hypothetical protein